VCPHPWLVAVMDRPDLQVHRLEAPERPFDVREALVGTDRILGRELIEDDLQLPLLLVPAVAVLRQPYSRSSAKVWKPVCCPGRARRYVPLGAASLDLPTPRPPE